MVNTKTIVQSAPEVNDLPSKYTTDILSGFFRATGFSPFCVHFLSSLTFQRIPKKLKNLFTSLSSNQDSKNTSYSLQLY